jgi:hypothetical protein
MSVRAAGVAGVLAFAAVVPGPAHGDGVDWMAEQGTVLEMKLAHRDTVRVDGGTLRVDRERRTVSWEGAPNEIGCAREWQASFDDVTGVRADAPGFLIGLRSGPVREVRLAPLPHFRALLGQRRDRGVRPHVRELLKDRDGDPIPLGGSGGSTTPMLDPVLASPEVQRDSEAAVDAILRALGRAAK